AAARRRWPHRSQQARGRSRGGECRAPAPRDRWLGRSWLLSRGAAPARWRMPAATDHHRVDRGTRRDRGAHPRRGRAAPGDEVAGFYVSALAVASSGRGGFPEHRHRLAGLVLCREFGWSWDELMNTDEDV